MEVRSRRPSASAIVSDEAAVDARTALRSHCSRWAAAPAVEDGTLPDGFTMRADEPPDRGRKNLALSCPGTAFNFFQTSFNSMPRS